MSMLLDCPHCSTRILPMPGRICPSCRENVDAQPEPEPKAEQVVEAAYGLAAAQMRQGVHPAGVEKTLTDRGLDPQSAAAIVGDLGRGIARARKEEGQKNMLFGALWCFGGIAVTALTYSASAGPGGGRFMIAWGAIVFGGIQFIRGMIQSSSDAE